MQNPVWLSDFQAPFLHASANLPSVLNTTSTSPFSATSAPCAFCYISGRRPTVL